MIRIFAEAGQRHNARAPGDCTEGEHGSREWPRHPIDSKSAQRKVEALPNLGHPPSSCWNTTTSPNDQRRENLSVGGTPSSNPQDVSEQIRCPGARVGSVTDFFRGPISRGGMEGGNGTFRPGKQKKKEKKKKKKRKKKTKKKVYGADSGSSLPGGEVGLEERPGGLGRTRRRTHFLVSRARKWYHCSLMISRGKNGWGTGRKVRSNGHPRAGTRISPEDVWRFEEKEEDGVPQH